MFHGYTGGDKCFGHMIIIQHNETGVIFTDFREWKSKLTQLFS